MNINFNLYDQTEGKEFGEFETLKLGGHEIVIVDAKEYTGQTGNVSLKIEVDISGNDEQKGWFKKIYDENTNSDKKWSNGACRYISLKDENIAYLKGFITALERSNKDFTFNKQGTWEQLKNLKCAGVFGWEEYQKEDGTVGVATKLTQIRSLDKLNNIKIPSVRTLDGMFVDYEEYKANKNNITKNDDSVVIVDDSMLPF